MKQQTGLHGGEMKRTDVQLCPGSENHCITKKYII
jgi:hypothetical protein